ncbi:MAG: polysaccharide deacetylase family protein [Candidatus Roizmanbacteria bacterium]|nr:MAG: polysaccharide deacetylase family protein [Candidatus Roizmanbacteria bacterium]
MRKAIKKVKRKRSAKRLKLSRLWIWTLLLGVILGSGISLSGNKLFFSQVSSDDFRTRISAKYYDPKDLQKPDDVKGISTAKLKLPIVMYHYVEYVKDKGDTIRQSLNINPYLFEGQLKNLKENRYTSYFARDIPMILKGKIKAPAKSIILTFDDGYKDFYTDAFPLLKKYKIKSTIYIVNNFIGRKDFLNEDEIKELISSGLVEIGAHTTDHLYLKGLSKTMIRQQILESKQRLEEDFNIKVKTFAYPYGAFNSDVIDAVKEASFSAAVTVVSGTFQVKDDIFSLNRVRAGGFSVNNMDTVLTLYKN